MNTFEKIAHLAAQETLEKYAGQTAATIAGVTPFIGPALGPTFADPGRAEDTGSGARLGATAGGITLGALGLLLGRKLGRLRSLKNIKDLRKARDKAAGILLDPNYFKSKVKGKDGTLNLNAFKNDKSAYKDYMNAKAGLMEERRTGHINRNVSNLLGTAVGGMGGQMLGGGLGAYLGHGPDKK